MVVVEEEAPPFTPRFRDGKGTGGEKGRPPAFTTRLRNGKGRGKGTGREEGAGSFPGEVLSGAHRLPSLPLPAVPVSPQLFFSGDGRDVSGDGRRESEGKREREPALSIPSFFVVPFTFSSPNSRVFFRWRGREGKAKGGGKGSQFSRFPSLHFAVPHSLKIWIGLRFRSGRAFTIM